MRTRTPVIVIASFMAGAIAVLAASKVARSDKALFEGKQPKEAALEMLAVAESQAEKGTWERIGVARVYYLMGEKAKAGEILDMLMQEKLKADDWIRLGSLYAEAGEWARAEEAFEKALAMDPKDPEYPAEAGAWYNLKGDRAKAEELFAKSFSLKADEVWNTLNVAGSYVGIKPQ